MKMEYNAYQTDNMFDYTASQHKHNGMEIFLSCFRCILLFFFSQIKVMLKRVGNYATFRYTVQCPYRILNFRQWVHLKKSYEP